MDLKGKILIVDDNEAMRFALQQLLSRDGHEVITADTGEMALQLALKHGPDLVLLDVRLPDINGLEVFRRLRLTEAVKNAFIVHMSAAPASPATRIRGLEEGADGYISQPIHNLELAARVRAFLRHKRTIDELRKSEDRYRKLFEINPLPMWVSDRENDRITAVNPAAINHYGYSETEFLQLTVRELQADANNAKRHVKKNGDQIDVAITQREIQWDGHPACVSLVVDETECRRIEQDKAKRVERYENEFAGLQDLGHGREISLEQQLAPLYERDLRLTNALAKEYQEILKLALDQKIFKTSVAISPRLERMAAELARAAATPRDVVELHYQVLKKLAPSLGLPKTQGYLEVGRITIIELMGYLAAAYRSSAFAAPTKRKKKRAAAVGE